MTEGTSAVLALLVLAWAVTSDLLARLNITGPLVFAIFGYALGNPDWGPLSVDVEAPSVHRIAELSLALLLFSDAARVNLSRLKADARLPGRLLAVGLPLSVILGSLFAAWFFADFTWALAGFVGATLAPTDAALSAQVINDRRIPMRLRRALNVESGLNDGIATPFVTLFLAFAISTQEHAAQNWLLTALGAVTLGVASGALIGAAGAWLLTQAHNRDWTSDAMKRLAILAVGLTAYFGAVLLQGNGFIAAFVAGITFGYVSHGRFAEPTAFTETLSELLSLLVWTIFGALILSAAFTFTTDWRPILYAVLSLTLIRMLPVALSLLGMRFRADTVAIIGWFGPRGLASVVFTLLAFEELTAAGKSIDTLVAVATWTILLSVFAHGLSARPLASWYARRLKAADTLQGELTELSELPLRRRVFRRESG